MKEQGLIKKIEEEKLLAGLALMTFIGIVLLESFLFRVSVFNDYNYYRVISGFIPLFFALIHIAVFDRKAYKPFLFILVLVLGMAGLSLLYLPYYDYWYLNFPGGLLRTVLRPDRGIVLILYLSLFKDDIKGLIKWASYGFLLVYIHDFLQYLAFLKRGYFISSNNMGVLIKRKYDLSLGYSTAMLFMYLIFLIRFEKSKKLRMAYVMGALCAFYISFIVGSRGALLSMMVYLVLVAVKSLKERRFFLNLVEYKGFLARILPLIFVLSLIIALVTPQYLNLTRDDNGNIIEKDEDSKKDEEKGIFSSRNAEIFKDGVFFEDSARINIYKMILGELRRSPLGLGVLADRPILVSSYTWGYSHNIILEILINFGLVFGPIVLVILAYMVIYLIFFEKQAMVSELGLFWIGISSAFAISFSFWLENFFWGFLGVFIIFSTKAKDLEKKLYRLADSNKLRKILVSLLALVLMFGLVNFYQYKAKANRVLVTVEEPTIVLCFDGTYSIYETEIEDKLTTRGISPTLFLSYENLERTERHLTKEQVKRLADKGWDIQDGGYYRENYIEFSPEKVKLSLVEFDKFMEEMGLEKPRVIAPPLGKTTRSLNKIFREHRDLIQIMAGQEKSDFVYKEIKEGDRDFLNGFYLNTRALLKLKDSPIKEEISSALNQEGLLVIRVELKKHSKIEEAVDALLDLIDELEKQGFTIKSIGEIQASLAK